MAYVIFLLVPIIFISLYVFMYYSSPKRHKKENTPKPQQKEIQWKKGLIDVLIQLQKYYNSVSQSEQFALYLKYFPIRNDFIECYDRRRFSKKATDYNLVQYVITQPKILDDFDCFIQREKGDYVLTKKGIDYVENYYFSCSNLPKLEDVQKLYKKS